jgi:hypothetical protein
MKPRLIPLYFKSGKDREFEQMLSGMRKMLVDEAEILSPQPVGSKLPDAEGALFLQLIGDAFAQINDIKKIKLPLIIITSEFGTVNIWDWEIVSIFRSHGMTVFAPYTRELTSAICRSLGLKKEMQETKFLVFQDNPGQGFQPEIFKRFYWWEKSCSKRIKEKFGIQIIKESYKKLGAAAKKISDNNAAAAAKALSLDVSSVSSKSLYSALKLYLALKNRAMQDPHIQGMGTNCLNESHFSDTTPCLAWCLLYEEMGIQWACEADTVSLTTQFLLGRSLKAPVIMSNVYPFLVGNAALKHERIKAFPKVDEPENHLLIVHCGYFGLAPKSCCSQWALKPKVLAIVNDNATAVDARLPQGKVTLVKLDPTFNKLMVIAGSIVDYVQYPGSDCRNGAVICIKDGHKLMKSFYSHHYGIIAGDRIPEIDFIAKTFGLVLEEY